MFFSSASITLSNQNDELSQITAVIELFLSILSNYGCKMCTANVTMYWGQFSRTRIAPVRDREGEGGMDSGQSAISNDNDTVDTQP